MDVATPHRWTESGLVAEFASQHVKMPDRRFAFVLGAGASVTSGIPAGGALARRWLLELHQREELRDPPRPPAQWATEALGFEGFTLEQAARFYPHIFERRFRDDPDSGFADLEGVMREAEPSFGYTVLAQLLSQTQHRVVITTNFDNLVADALAIYTQTSPLVAGHESLAQFARPQMRRPLVAKIHRDLLLAPHNSPMAVASLADGWVEALNGLFQSYTPIFIGYGGNDGSLMGYLEALSADTFPGRPIWCYRQADGFPPQRVQALVASLRGILVGIQGFDELMLRLSDALGFGLLHEQVIAQANARAEAYQEGLKALQAAINAPRPEPSEAERRDKRHHHGSTEGELSPTLPVFDLGLSLGRDDIGGPILSRKATAAPGRTRGSASEKRKARLTKVAFKEEEGEGDVDREAAQRAIDNLVKDPKTWWEWDLKAEAEVDPADREAVYRRALEALPDQPSLLNRAALHIGWQRGRMNEAVSLLRRAHALAPDNMTIKANLKDMEEEQGGA